MHKNAKLSERYADILKRVSCDKKKEKRTGEEIVTDLFKRHGLKFKEGGNA